MRLTARQWNDFESYREIKYIEHSGIDLTMNVIELRDSEYTPCVVGAGFVGSLYLG